MEDIDIGAISEALNNKVDLPTPSTPQNAVDYVIESQLPTSANGYTWYRKYKSGWVEQGGVTIIKGDGNSITLPVSMANTNYVVFSTTMQNTNAYNRCYSRTTTAISMATSGGDNTSSWQVSGMSAQ